MLRIKTVSSMEKIFFSFPEEAEELVSETKLKNEIYSFQIAIWLEGAEQQREIYKVEAESVIKDCVSIKQVGYVPSILPCYEDSDDDYISKFPGIFPDPLYTLSNGEVVLVNNQARALWITIGPYGKYKGKYLVVFKFYDSNDNLVAVNCIEPYKRR